MEVELIPRIDKVISLSSNIANQLKRKKQIGDVSNIFGKFYNGDRLAWLIDGSTLVVVHASNGNIYSIHNFGRNSSQDVFITHAVEFQENPQKWKLLVVTNNDNSKGSFLHIFNIRQSRVDKAIFIPEKVTSLEVVSCAGGVNRSNVLLGQALRFFHGIVAVGIESGGILLLDLGLDDDSDFECRGNDLFHSAIKISYFTGRLNDLPRKREDLAAENILMVYPLSVSSSKGGFYYYVSPEKEELLDFPAADVYVSTILYVQQLGCLFVGFNFGGFQIYDLTKLELVFTCDADEFNELPVIRFAFQEPENDPRNFCYVWIIRGQSDSSLLVEQLCHATMYSILFYNKTAIDGLGTCYLGLKECAIRFQFPLHGYMKSNQVDNWSSSRLITCCSIDSRRLKQESAARDSASERLRDEASICCCLFVWEAYLKDRSRNSKISLAIFDLNQWYQAQMPSTLKISSSEICPYFGFFSLDALNDLVSINSLVDLYLVTQSMTRPMMANHAESMFYPSALAFDVIGLTDTCIVHGSFLGLQRQVLQQIRVNAPTLLIEPTQTMDLCVYCSLITHPSGTIVSQMNSLSKREAIFSMALECDALDIIMSCIVGWASGRYASEGCTLRFVQDWAWKKVLKIKSFLDKQCTILYDCSGLQIDAIVGQSLRHHLVMLKDLEVIFKSLGKQTQTIPTSNQGARELEHRVSVITLLILHFDSVQWFINARLLPEAVEGDETDSIGFPYPKSFLTRIYNNRRAEIQRINSSLNPTDLLIIDGMVEDAGDPLVNLWKSQIGSGCYPPSSINALLNVYLLPELSLSVKHTLVQYFLLDLTELLQSGPYAHLSEPLSEYSAAFACTQSMIFLTKGFWLLDHKDFEGAINILLHPMVNPLDIKLWHSRRIMKAFLFQGEPEKALRFAHVHQPCKETAEDVQFYLTLLLANGMVADAISYLRSVRDQTNSEELIQHFFLGCQQTNNLRGMLQLLYSAVEEQSLVKFMTNNSDPKVRELLVIYHLQRSHFIEALQLNDQLNADVMHVTDPSAKERATTRNAIIEGYSKVYPNIQLELAKLTRSALSQRKLFWEKGRKQPTPLSTAVMTNPVEPISKASVLEAVMEKITEIWTQSSPIRCDSNPNQPTFSLTKTPFTPRRSISKESQQAIIHPTIQRRNSLELQPGATETYLNSSPTKSRYLDVSPFHLTESSKRRTNSKLYNSELLSLLQPVPVKRKVVVHKLLTSTSSVSSSPASILKQRAPIRPAKETESNPTTSTIKQSSLAAVAAGDRERDLIANLIRTPISTPIATKDDLKSSKIRFSSQKMDVQLDVSPILSPSTPMNEWSGSSYSDKSLELSASVTPRRPLHMSDQSLSPQVGDENLAPTLEKPVLERTEESVKDDDSDDVMMVDDEFISNSDMTTPQKDNEAKDGDEDESIYVTPDKMESSPDTSGTNVSERSTTPQPIKHKSYFSAAGFMERISWIKSELAKETLHISDEITITSSFTTDKTEIKIVDKPPAKSLVERTVDSCFANDDTDLLAKYKSRKKKGTVTEEHRERAVELAADDEQETVRAESKSPTPSVTDEKNSETASNRSVTPSQVSELTVNVEFPGITKASLRSWSPKSSPSSVSQSSKSDRESVTSVDKNVEGVMEIVPANLETVVEEESSKAVEEIPAVPIVPKETTKPPTSALRKPRKRISLTKHNLQTFVFSPPTVMDTEAKDIAETSESTSPVLSPASTKFLFSTPLTRSKVKARKSIASAIRIGQRSAGRPASSAAISHSATPKRLGRPRRSSEASSSDALINFESPALDDKPKTPKARHNMTLRRSQMKTRRITKFS